MAMKENFKTILSVFNDAGMNLQSAEYSITQYSLNTDLSFKFRNLKEFTEFLCLDGDDIEKIKAVHALLAETGISPRDFFYVNFYKPKVTEL